MALIAPVRHVINAETEATRIRMMLSQAVSHIELSLRQTERLTRTYGRKQIDAALGADAAQLPVVYGELSRCVAALKPGVKIPDLPG